MLLWKRIIQLRAEINRQRKWMDRCGGDRAGYIQNYGDPGIPPLKADGSPKTLAVPSELAVGLLQAVPGQVGLYFAEHLGDGGTAIYHADKAHLERLIEELDTLSARHPVALQTANQRE